jgi:hypothetical protein
MGGGLLVTASRQNEYWRPEPLWKGMTAFILAGGPSLKDFDVTRLQGRMTIAINSSCLIAPWADILYFIDSSWWDNHRDIVMKWPGLVFTDSRRAKGEAPDRLMRLQHEQRQDFPPPGSPVIRYGRSSGHMAVSLSVALGCKRIVLLGYDMKISGNRSHHHDDPTYRNNEDNLKHLANTYASSFVPSFRGWHAAAKNLGVDVVNATPDSALQEFPFVDIKDELRAA